MNTWKFQSLIPGFDAAIEPADIYAERGEIERMAEAIFNTDEDMKDEAVGIAIKGGDKDAMRNRETRIRWEHIDPKIQIVYRRRALAASAAIQLTATELKLMP